MAKKDQATQVEDQELDQAEVTEQAEQAEALPEQTNATEQAEPATEAEQPQAAPADEAVYVTVTVPKAFKLRTTHDHIVDYAAGICEMPIEHAEHWYAKANGVTIYKK